MKFEVKTQNDDFSRSSSSVFLALAIFSLLIILSNITIKLGTISRNSEINYLCKFLIVENKSSNFKKLSKLSKLTSKQKIWDLCKEIVK